MEAKFFWGKSDDIFNRRAKGASLVTFPSDYVVLDLETTGLDPTWNEITWFLGIMTSAPQ